MSGHSIAKRDLWKQYVSITSLHKLSREVGRTTLNSELPSLATTLENVRILEGREGEVAGSVKCSLYTQEDLSPSPGIHPQMHRHRSAQARSAQL